jgi:C-terminal processing protease CtpA/Prc
VLIGQVQDGSPADEAGLRRGDILVRFNGRTVHSASELSQAVRDQRPGERVRVSVWRNGSELPLRVTLASRPQEERGETGETPEAEPPDKDHPDVEAPEAPSPPDDVREQDRGHEFNFQLPDDQLERHIQMLTLRPRLGVELQDLDPQLGAYFDRPDGRGVLITRVQPDTPGDRAGLKAGDVIIELGDRKVDTSADLRRELSQKDEGPVRVTVLRRGQRQTLTARLEARESQRWLGTQPRMNVRRLHPQEDEDMRRQMDELRRQMDVLKRQLESMRQHMDQQGGQGR